MSIPRYTYYMLALRKRDATLVLMNLIKTNGARKKENNIVSGETMASLFFELNHNYIWILLL